MQICTCDLSDCFVETLAVPTEWHHQPHVNTLIQIILKAIIKVLELHRHQTTESYLFFYMLHMIIHIKDDVKMS